MKRVAMVGLVVAAGILVGCGESKTETVTTTTAAELSAEERQDQKNEKVADNYIAIAPKQFANICKSMEGPYGVSEATTEHNYVKILGKQIAGQGGEPDEVAELLVEAC